MARKRKHPRLPNGYGSIKKLSGKNRRNPYGVYPPTTEFTIDGIPVPVKALCYVDDWYKAFTVLTWYNNGEYYPGREKELSSGSESLYDIVTSVLKRYSQTNREIVGQATFSDVFRDFYRWKYGKEYGHREKKSATEFSSISAYKNTASLHDVPFSSISPSDLQKVIDDCPLKYSSLELIKSLFNQMYRYAIANDITEKDCSRIVRINQPDDDEKGVPFSDEELSTLWRNKENPVAEMLLIMCYSGFRISEYNEMEINLEEGYFCGGLKTKAGKNRIVPIHSAIIPLVRRRLESYSSLLHLSTAQFRNHMYKTLSELEIQRHTPHDCRHTFSRLCDQYEVAENDKKTMMGHAFKDITNKVYRHRNLKELRKQIEKISVSLVCH